MARLTPCPILNQQNQPDRGHPSIPPITPKEAAEVACSMVSSLLNGQPNEAYHSLIHDDSCRERSPFDQQGITLALTAIASQMVNRMSENVGQDPQEMWQKIALEAAWRAEQ